MTPGMDEPSEQLNNSLRLRLPQSICFSKNKLKQNLNRTFSKARRTLQIGSNVNDFHSNSIEKKKKYEKKRRDSESNKNSFVFEAEFIFAAHYSFCFVAVIRRILIFTPPHLRPLSQPFLRHLTMIGNASDINWISRPFENSLFCEKFSSSETKAGNLQRCFAQSVHIRLASPQAVRLSTFYMKISCEEPN